MAKENTPKTTSATVDLDQIHFDEEFQCRADLHTPEEIEDLAELIKTKKFDLNSHKIDVAHVKSIGMICTDGFKRGAAAKMAGKKVIGIRLTVCSLFHARHMACIANRGQVAKPLSRADKRRQVTQFLEAVAEAKKDKEWSNRAIADEFGVSHTFVNDLRRVETFPPNNSDNSEEIPLDDAPANVPPTQRKPVASVDSDNWEDCPLAEFLNSDQMVWDALNTLRIVTAGDLYHRITVKKEKLGLPLADLDELRKACEKLRDGHGKPAPKALPAAPEKKVGAEKGFDFRGFDAAFGIVARGPNELAAMHAGEEKAIELRECIRQLNEFRKTWEKWVARLPKGAK
jgi:hypothetical protein